MEQVRPVMIELYSMHVSDYLKYMQQSSIISGLSNSNVVIYHGWKLLAQVFTVLHSLKYTKQQIHEKLIHTYYLYVEYVEKIHIKNMCEALSPSVFVYNQIIGDVYLNTPPDGNQRHNVAFFLKLTKWSEILLVWNNPYFVSDQRALCIQTFLYNYLVTLCKDKYYHCFRLLEILQEHWTDKRSYSELHIRILYDFFTRIQSDDTCYTLQYIQDLCFTKFVQESDTLKGLIIEVSKTKQVKKLVEWLFTPLPM
jgi:hypothetical protein